MQLEEYIEKAWSTALYPNKGSNWTYPTLGLVGEIAETLQKFCQASIKDELIKELSDVMWYINALSKELNIDILEDLTTEFDNPVTDGDGDIYNDAFVRFIFDDMVVRAGVIAECAKKTMRDDDGTITDDRHAKVSTEVRIIHARLVQLAEAFGSTIEDVRQINIDKLFSRKERGVIKGDGDNR